MLELEMWGRATENFSCDDLNLLIHKKRKEIMYTYDMWMSSRREHAAY